MAKVVDIKKPFIHQGVIKTLEEALELAKQGELTGLALVADCFDGSYYTAWQGQSTLSLIGGLHEAAQLITNSRIERVWREDV